MNKTFDLAPDDRADESVRKILRRLFVVLRSNVDGTAEDADIECLHDLRVANRRTRSALSQLKDVLPASVGEHFQPEFKWLGSVTGPCRDLDVFLNTLVSSRQESGDLGPLQESLREKRRREHSLVCAALRSVRFQRLLEDWELFLEVPIEEGTSPPLAATSIIEVASPRILKAFRKMQRRGAGIETDPPADLLHRLRIDGKKLRYLLEFFSELYSEATANRFITELKHLQNNLGDFNDTAIQLDLIEELVEQYTPPVETLAAVNRLTEAITERQRRLRAEFSNRFNLFAGDESRTLYEKTFRSS